MKPTLDWTTDEVVNIFDEATLWSAPFGKMLLDHIPMKKGATIADIGFGTGFPLIELSQRFGPGSHIYGIDIWPAGIRRSREKIKTLALNNIEILEESAARIHIDDGAIDLVSSNLGINNFDEKEAVYAEVYRILHQDGRLCLTTNPIGTFQELFDLFQAVLVRMNLAEEQEKLAQSIRHRNTEEGLISELAGAGFQLVKVARESAIMRFVDGEALMNHSLIRIGFRPYWEEMIRAVDRAAFFDAAIAAIEEVIASQGEFVMRIPMLYLEFGKGNSSS